MKINVNSEIGKLRKILVHRPGKEVERIYPEIFEKLLFDDIMYLEKAQEEHDAFTKVLRDQGIEVFYIEKILAEALDTSDEIRKKFIDKFLDQANIDNETVFEACKKYFYSIKNNYELVMAAIAGVKKSEIDPKFKNTLEDHCKKEDEYPFYIDPILNVLFQRDAMISIFNHTKINNMFFETRKREAIFTQFAYKYHPSFKDIPILQDSNSKGTLEGGDVLVLNKETVFAGISQRTSAEGIQGMADRLFEEYPNFKNLIAIQIPKGRGTMHIDTILTQMDHEKFSVDVDTEKLNYEFFKITREKTTKHEGKIIDLLKEYISPNVELIPVAGGDPVAAKSEQWNDGANCLAIRPGTIVVYDRNTVTNKVLRKHGINVIEVPSSELSRGRGGPRCMSMPLDREEI